MDYSFKKPWTYQFMWCVQFTNFCWIVSCLKFFFIHLTNQWNSCNGTQRQRSQSYSWLYAFKIILLCFQLKLINISYYTKFGRLFFTHTSMFAITVFLYINVMVKRIKVDFGLDVFCDMWPVPVKKNGNLKQSNCSKSEVGIQKVQNVYKIKKTRKTLIKVLAPFRLWAVLALCVILFVVVHLFERYTTI